MRVAALNDVHGNLPALEAVLAELPPGTLIVFGGDIVAGPLPQETLDRIEALGDQAVGLRGNADHGDGWALEALSPRQRRFLEQLPPTRAIDIDGLGPTLFCHGSPRDENEILTVATSEERLRRILAGVAEKTVVCGHTHHQFDRRVDGHRVVNAGSVGMAYEGRRGAFWALLGAQVELRRTDYDVEAAVEAFRATGYPGTDDVSNLLEPPTALEAAEFFERQALEHEAS